jgi:hypothetical protein
MAILSLESLVLRGVRVLCDGQNVELRTGTRSVAGGQPSAVVNSMRHPSPGCRQAYQPAGDPDHAVEDGEAEACGAGRSRLSAGVLSRRSPARNAGGTVRSGWSLRTGGAAITAAVRSGLAWRKASGGDIFGRHNSVSVRGLPGHGTFPNAGVARKRLTGLLAWSKPASRTPPAST